MAEISIRENYEATAGQSAIAVVVIAKNKARARSRRYQALTASTQVFVAPDGAIGVLPAPARGTDDTPSVSRYD